MGFGLLRVLNDDIIEPGTGFPTHHHDNMEIVTIVLSGALEHKDSTGGEGVIKSGEVQRMSAGRGIYHSEANPFKEPVHLLQIWVETASEVAPSYEQKPVKIPTNTLAEVVGGKGLKINQDASFLLGKLEEGKEVEHAVRGGAYVFVISGKIQIGPYELAEGDAAGVTDARSVKIVAKEDSKILVIEVPME